jgi:hypothetical protein
MARGDDWGVVGEKGVILGVCLGSRVFRHASLSGGNSFLHCGVCLKEMKVFAVF